VIRYDVPKSRVRSGIRHKATTFPKTSLLALLLLSAPTFAATTEDLLNQLEATEDAQVALKLIHQIEPVSALSVLDQGRYYARLGLVQEDALHDIDAAEVSFNRAITLLEPMDKPIQALADAYYERAYIKYLRTYNPDVYCPDRELAVAMTRQLNNTDLLVKYLAALSICHKDSPEQFQKALALLNEAMSLAEKNNLSADRRSMIYNATSLAYRTNQLYDKAYEYTQLAYDLWASVDDRQSMDDMQHTLVGDAINLGELDKAEEHARQLFKLADTSPDFKNFRFFAYYDTGLVAMAKKELPRAIKLFEQAKTEEKNTEEEMFVALNRMQLARAYFENGNTESALQETAHVTQLPAYKSFQPGEKQFIQSLMQFQKGHAAVAMRLLLDLNRNEHELRRQFVKNANRNFATQHDNRLQQFEKQLLENKLQIQELQLNAQRRRQETSRWYLLLASAVALSLALLAYTLLRSRRRFREQAQTDALTGIPNRRHFFDFTDRLVRRAKQQGGEVSVLVLDIDHFKSINDTYGHHAGDAVIRHVAANALTCLRSNDLLSRTGGEEFAAILPQTNVELAWAVAERMRMRIESNPLHHHGNDIRIAVSIGLATGMLTADDPQNLLQIADQAMYRAKAAGRNQTHIATHNTNSSAPNDRAMVTDQLIVNPQS
jgi:diguanylate cyclase (GGDEF)-like protein